MTLDERIGVFDQLGRILENWLISATLAVQSRKILENAIKEASVLNPWFTRQNILTALSAISKVLNRRDLNSWLKQWDPELLFPEKVLKIGVIMAGNIPLAGFHDFLSVLITGHRFIGKLSSRDDRLLPMISKLISLISYDLGKHAEFTEEKLSGTDAIIATGSNNTYRYFDFYFGKYPHIFRKNRNGAAILMGNETPDQLANLGADIFTYFGLGCRNVSKLFVPSGYDFRKFFEELENFSSVREHNKYMNNYQYYRSVYLLNKIPHLDNGFLILKHDETYHSPAGVLYYAHYSSPDNLVKKLSSDTSLLQCIAANEIPGLKTIPFGKTQFPELWDYADNINTVDFLINLVKSPGHDF